VLLNITGGPDMSLFEVNEASSLIQAEAHEDANIIFGTVIDETMGDEIRITVIATGFEDLNRRKNNLVNMPGMSGHKREDISKPAYLRKDNRPIDQMPTVKMGMIEDNDDPDLEIPTFLRRQAD
jgi:cell division protein FtsZ